MSLTAATPGIEDDPLARRLAALEAENARLRRDLECSEQLAASLREANEHLVLAAVDAQTSRDDAEETNRRQNEFLAMLAHELRNPLVPISVSASLLERTAGLAASAGQFDRLTSVIQRQVDHMARLLDDLLDAARLSSGKITLAVEPLRLSELLEHAADTVLPRVRERGQDLGAPRGADGLTVDGDRVRLTQVFTNLLSNASKYTQDGGRIEIAVDADDGGGIAVAIADNGSGMSENTIASAFDLFTQGPRSLARSEGGLGVGLNVVRNLVTMHGGSVAAASPGPGQGSVFTVRLPRSRAAAPDVLAPDPRAGSAQRRRILIVEDNADASDMLRMLLELEGHQVEIAGDGHAGLALALEGRFDVVVCDIGLPGIDGFELMARLRAAPGTGTGRGGMAPLTIALSGYGQPADRERALAAGFDRYLVKPVAPDVLIGALGG